MRLPRQGKGLTLEFGDATYVLKDGTIGWFVIAASLEKESSTDKLIRQIYGSKEWWA